MLIVGNSIYAEDGGYLRRKSDGKIFGTSCDLGYIYYLNDEKLETPILESPEDYEEIAELSE